MTVKMPTVPTGWEIELINGYGGGFMLIRSPMGLMAMLDTKYATQRGFRTGHVTVGRLTSTRTYAGRGWLQQLADDAVAHLAAIERLDAARRRR